MKNKLYKPIITLLAVGFFGVTSAQKFDKKYSENFTVNKDVEVKINAANADINVTTWNKNEVQVDAYIEIEGVTKEEAEKYFSNWKFEALGNKKKVEIKADNSILGRLGADFTYLDNMNFDFTFPDVDLSKMETIVIPNIDFDFKDFEMPEINLDIDEMVEKDEKYEFRWKDEENDIKISSKEEWEAFKKTKKYKELKEKLKSKNKDLKYEFSVARDKVKKELLENREKMKKELEKARVEIKKINKEEIRASLEKARAELEKMRTSFADKNGEVTINGKKVKIKKRIEIKVPKEATFDLNTRHCKVKLPNTVASGNVKYGSFDANNLMGGKLTVNYSPVTIKDLNACTLFLNNVTDAKIASVTNTSLSNNSSGLRIERVNQNVRVFDKFGEILIESFDPNFGEFIITLSNSEATLQLNNIPAKYEYSVEKINLENTAKKSTTSKNKVQVNGKYSTVVIK